MPIYEYKCGVCATRYERLTQRIGEGPALYDECPECGNAEAELAVSIPAMRPDDMWMGKVDPTFGYVTSRSELRQKERASGLRVHESGMDRDIARARKHREEQQDRAREKHIAKTVKDF